MTELRPAVWQMVREALDALGGACTNAQIRTWILRRYPGTNDGIIRCQIIYCTVNHASRIHTAINQQPREAFGPYDFLFRTGRGRVERFNPARHGRWRIVESPGVGLAVAQA